MSGRILVVEESRRVVTALRRALEPAGFRVDAAAPAAAIEAHDPERHVAAIVRALPGAGETIAALREADPSLAVVALFEDDAEADAGASALGADGVLVGPLRAAAVVTAACRMAARMREQSRRIAELAAPVASRDLDFLKRMLFVEVKRSRRYHTPIALALVGIDGWPAPAARLGARARARLLADVLATLSSSVREIDIAVPFADDRFVVLMPHTDGPGGLEVSRRLCARIREGSLSARLTASVGVAAHAGDGPVSFSALVKRAADALERARRGGGDRAEGEAAGGPKRAVRR
jgi:diguanylate cyclase (GGDEF)-like protein